MYSCLKSLLILSQDILPKFLDTILSAVIVISEHVQVKLNWIHLNQWKRNNWQFKGFARRDTGITELIKKKIAEYCDCPYESSNLYLKKMIGL